MNQITRLIRKEIAAVLVFSVIAVTVFATPSQAAKKKAVLAKNNMTLTVNEKKQIVIKKKKRGAKYSYQVKNKKIAKVTKKGKITAKKAGKTKITVKEKFGKKTRTVGKILLVVKEKPLPSNSNPPAGTAGAVTPAPTAPAPTVPAPATNTPSGTDTPSSAPDKTPVPEIPGYKNLDISAAKPGNGTLTYNKETGLLCAENINYFFVPLPESLTPGSKVKVTIKGNYTGTKGFRVWLAGESDGSYSNQANSVESGISGEFNWEFTLTATDDVSTLQFKGITYSDNIDTLELSQVAVSYEMNKDPLPTPIPLPTDLPADKVPARETTAPGEHASASLPLMYSDVPDMDYIRVGEDYYMVSTTMFLNPGVPIMHSKDLVHWEIVSYVYDTLEDNDTTNLLNGKQCYGKGSWAASLKYNEGTYYVCFSSNDQAKFYVYTTEDIVNGPWKKHSASGTKHDPGLLFDGDKMYLFSGNGNITMQEIALTEDSIEFKGSAATVLKKASSQNIVSIEGAHAYKIGEYYYLFFIEWPKSGKRMQWCYRTKSLTEEWEGKVVFCNDGNYSGAGIAQGGIIDTIYGDWYAILFQDHGAVGRTPVLLDVYWVDGWPMLGSDSGKASASEKLDVNLTSSGKDYIYADDDFSYTENKLKLVWQWNHNPDNANWSVTEREGYLRLTTGSLATSIKDARNSLTQRTYGPSCTSETCIDVTNMKNGDYAGICAFQNAYGQAGVMKDENGNSFIYYGSGTDSLKILDSDKVALNQNQVYLKVTYDFVNNIARCYYSLDGTNWVRIGSDLKMTYDLSIFMGYRTYLYNYATKETGGSVDFDYYKIYA